MLLLSPKKFLVFRGRPGKFSVGVALALAVALALPGQSQAGILSLLSRFFVPRPAEVEETSPAFVSESHAATSALAANDYSILGGARAEGWGAAISIFQEDALLAPLNPLGTVSSADVPPAGQIFIYTIRPGDTLSTIAQSFDVSVNTILWANNVSDVRSLRVGDELVILPVTGVKHEVRKGETIAAIAQRYRASIGDVLSFNGLAPDEALDIGKIVIVPNGELAQATPLTPGAAPSRLFANLPRYDDFYIRPISAGRRSRGLHGYNGVDLANSCGLAVLAAADGTVLLARLSGWNGGYGRYVVISHANGTQTLYGHLKEVLVQPGASVRHGELIGTIGSSGNSTGCHVHFEVRGARNPF